MIHKDFIARLIEQLGQVLRKMADRRAKGQLEEASDVLREGYRELFGIDPSLLCMLEASTLLGMLESPQHVQVLVSLARADAELQLERGNAMMASLIAAQALELIARSGLCAESVNAEDLLALRSLAPTESRRPKG